MTLCPRCLQYLPDCACISCVGFLTTSKSQAYSPAKGVDAYVGSEVPVAALFVDAKGVYSNQGLRIDLGESSLRAHPYTW